MAIGTTLENRKMKAPPNKFADCEDGNYFCQTGKCGIVSGIVSRQVNEKKKLSNDKERTGKHFVRTFMYFHLVLVLS